MKNYKANLIIMTSGGKQLTLKDIQTSALNKNDAEKNLKSIGSSILVGNQTIEIDNVSYLTNRIDHFHLDNLREYEQ